MFHGLIQECQRSSLTVKVERSSLCNELEPPGVFWTIEGTRLTHCGSGRHIAFFKGGNAQVVAIHAGEH
ncbi:MAG: hypothetical protein RBT80_19270, partial [Candidatus Vecturithrix sp.]|nr:hypothetical protein [Candidatus Vecturithrix sp.]